jgi:hypothetical protein
MPRLTLDDMRMRCAEDDVDGLRMRRENLGEGIDDILDALVCDSSPKVRITLFPSRPRRALLPPSAGT